MTVMQTKIDVKKLTKSLNKRLELTRKLLKCVNSKYEQLFLLGMKEALEPFRYFSEFIELKGGDLF